MKRHDDLGRLTHMRDHAREAMTLAGDATRADLDRDRKLELALVRLVEIVGEAAARVSEPLKIRHPHIPWAEIIGMRNRIVHGYDTVDLDIRWGVIATDLPDVVGQLDHLIEQIQAD